MERDILDELPDRPYSYEAFERKVQRYLEFFRHDRVEIPNKQYDATQIEAQLREVFEFYEKYDKDKDSLTTEYAREIQPTVNSMLSELESMLYSLYNDTEAYKNVDGRRLMFYKCNTFCAIRAIADINFHNRQTKVNDSASNISLS